MSLVYEEAKWGAALGLVYLKPADDAEGVQMSSKRHRKSIRAQPGSGGEERPRQRSSRVRQESDIRSTPLRRRSTRWIALACGATLIAALVLFRDAILGELIESDVVSDAFREVKGDSPVEIVRVEKVTLADEFMTFALPDAYRLSVEDEAIVKDVSNERWGPIIERVRASGLAPEKSTWRIYLRGKRNQAVRLLDITVENIEREPPLSGTLFHIPPQGDEQNLLLGINLDDLNPLPRQAELLGGQLQYREAYFDANSIRLTYNEERVIVMRAVTEKNTVSFSLTLHFQTADQSGSIKIDDDGRPFKLTAYNCVADKLVYQQFYSVAFHDTYGIYPEPPTPDRNCQLF